MKRIALLAMAMMVTLGLHAALPQDRPLNQAPAGFTNLFNGKDLSGWRGRQMDYSPHLEALLTKEELAAKQVEWNADRDTNWSVDAGKRRNRFQWPRCVPGHQQRLFRFRILCRLAHGEPQR